MLVVLEQQKGLELLFREVGDVFRMGLSAGIRENLQMSMIQ